MESRIRRPEKSEERVFEAKSFMKNRRGPPSPNPFPTPFRDSVPDVRAQVLVVGCDLAASEPLGLALKYRL